MNPGGGRRSGDSMPLSPGRLDRGRLRAAVDLVVERLHPEQVILFGSAARGEMSPDSDLDFLVIREREPGAQAVDHRRWTRGRTAADVDVDVDLVLMDRSTAESGRLSASRVQGAALEEGRTVYGRAGVSLVPTGPTYHRDGHAVMKSTLFAPDHADEFLDQAERKWTTANSGDSGHPADRCEYLQACMERALKALVVARGRRARHTHDLNVLWDQVEGGGEPIPVVPERRVLDDLSRFAGDWQYAGPGRGFSERLWAAARPLGSDLLDYARRRVPELVRETTAEIARLRESRTVVAPRPPGGGRKGRTDVADTGPKSAVELALERLRRQDAEAGGAAADGGVLTDDQKQAIAAARRDYEAKVAEAEILMRSKLAAVFDPEGRQEIEANHRRDLGQFASARDRKIAAIRKGDRA